MKIGKFLRHLALGAALVTGGVGGAHAQTGMPGLGKGVTWPYGPFIIDPLTVPTSVCVATSNNCFRQPTTQLVGTWDGTNWKPLGDASGETVIVGGTPISLSTLFNSSGANYVTSAQLTAALLSYVTTATLTSTLSGYATNTALAGYVPTTTTVTGTGGLAGGGALASNLTIGVANNGITNGMLAQAATLTLKGNITGGTANESDVTLSAAIDAGQGNAQGDILYRGASGWVALTPGTSGQVLTTKGTSANPVWGTAGGGAPQAAVALSANTTIDGTYTGKTVLLSGSATATLGSGTATAGWYMWVKKTDGIGTWAITPASGTIDSLSTINCYQESYLIWYDSANSVYRSQDRPKGWISLGTTTISSAVANVTFQNGFADSELRDMQFVISGIVNSSPSTVVDLTANMIQSGSTNTGTNYNSNTTVTKSTSVAGQNFGGTTFFYCANLYVNTATSLSAVVDLHSFADTTGKLQSFASSGTNNSSASLVVIGQMSNNLAWQGVVFQETSGSLVSGIVTQRGYRP